MKYNKHVIITLISMRGGEAMRELINFIIAVTAQRKPLRLVEEW